MNRTGNGDSPAFRSRLGALLKPYQWSFIGYLIVAQLLPTFYSLSNTYWIGHISNNALAITEQYEFPSVIIEIVNQTIPFGVLALVAQNFKDKRKVTTILKSGLVVQLIFSTALMSMMLAFTPQFISTIGTPAAIVSQTRSYLFLQSIALPFSSVSALLLVAIISMRKGRTALYLVLSSVVLNMTMDLFLISSTSLSIHMGIEGSALGYVVSQIGLLFVTALFAARIFSVGWASISLSRWGSMVRPLFSIGGWTGLDSLVRNVGYILVPLNVLNVIGVNQYGGYELAMTVMWTVIIPVLAIVQGTQVTVGNYFGEHEIANLKKVVLTSFLLVTGIMTVIAICGMFYWNALSSFFNQNPAMVGYSTDTFWWMMFPYVLYGLGQALQSTFYGTGRTKNIPFISGICNFRSDGLPGCLF
jgi:Na+-driven multidrug efflux pump